MKLFLQLSPYTHVIPSDRLGVVPVNEQINIALFVRIAACIRTENISPYNWLIRKKMAYKLALLLTKFHGNKSKFLSKGRPYRVVGSQIILYGCITSFP